MLSLQGRRPGGPDCVDLWRTACLVASSIRGQLDVDQVPHDAARLVGSAFAADRVAVHLVVDGRLRCAAGWSADGRGTDGRDADGRVAPDPSGRCGGPVERLRALYSRVATVGTSGGAGAFVQSDAGSSVLTMPFGHGDELLGGMILIRHAVPGDPRYSDRTAWCASEVETISVVAQALAQAYDLADGYRRESERVDRMADQELARSEFLSTVSHELRTPLASIAGYVEALLDGDGGPVAAGQRRMLDTIERNSQRLRGLIDDLLTLSQIGSGTFPCLRVPLDLVDLVVDAVADIQPAADRASVALHWCAPAGPVVVDGDRDQLHRMVINLLSNAVKFTPAGGRVSIAVSATADDQAELTVADTGIGIPTGEQDRLFTRFFRASNATSNVIAGTGLGLTIIEAIVSHHGGVLSLSSVEHQGTTVTVRLPRRPGAGGAADHDGVTEDAELALRP